MESLQESWEGSIKIILSPGPVVFNGVDVPQFVQHLLLGGHSLSSFCCRERCCNNHPLKTYWGRKKMWRIMAENFLNYKGFAPSYSGLKFKDFYCPQVWGGSLCQGGLPGQGSGKSAEEEDSYLVLSVLEPDFQKNVEQIRGVMGAERIYWLR